MTQTRVLTTDTPDRFHAAVADAAACLAAGQLVALPTETVYGLAANALNPEAVAAIFRAKQRPPENPIIVHVADLLLARQCASTWPKAADALAHAFWPGPLTLVVPKAPHIPDIVTAGGNTVGIRWPSHPFIQAVLIACGFPLAAPSANLSTRTSPTTAPHVLASLQGRIPLLIDGGPCTVGIESTVVDLTVHPPRILRPGIIHEESLRAVLGQIATQPAPAGSVLRSPGQLDKHYAPHAPLRILTWHSPAELAAQLNDHAHTCILAHATIPNPEPYLRVSVIPHDPDAYARALYAELHRCDDAGARCIVVEQVPQSAAWQGVADRLRRAASP